MAVSSTITNISPLNYVDTSSRYDNSNVIYWSDQNFLTFETYKVKPIPEQPTDRFWIIEAGFQYRPDLVAFKAYANERLWWKIMQANNLKDIYDFKTGLQIRIPSSF